MGSNGLSNSVLTPEEATFVVDVAKDTKIDPRVLISWASLEGADAAGGTGGYDYLNLRPEKGDTYKSVSSGGFEQFATVSDAVAATVHRFEEPFAKPILNVATAQGTPEQEIAAIGGSKWDAGHYGGSGGKNLLAKFNDLFANGATSAYVPPSDATSITQTVGTGSAGDLKPGGSVGDAGAAIAETPAAVADQAVNGWLGGLESWIKGAAPTGLAYVILTVLGIALVGFGLLEVLGYSPGRIARTALGPAAGAPGSSKLAAGDSIPF